MNDDLLDAPDLDDDPELTGLADLTTHDVGGWRQQHVRLRAHQALSDAPRSGFGRLWDRTLEPALLTAICGAHLLWMFAAAASVLLR